MSHLINIKNEASSNVKIEYLEGFCQCCLSENNLRSMLQPYEFQDVVESYADMLNSCYSIEIANEMTKNEAINLICDGCIMKLRESYSFRKQIEDVQSKLKKSIFHVSLPEDIYVKDEIPNNEYMWDDNRNSDSNDDLLIVKSLKESEPLKNRTEKNIYEKDEISNNKYMWDDNHNSDSNELLIVKNLKDRSKSLKKRIGKSKTLKSVRKALKNNDNIKRKKSKITIPKNALNKEAVMCEICTESFPLHKDLVNHLSVHFPNYVCDLCGRQFLFMHGLSNHLRTHVKEKIPCKICNKKLKVDSMRRHLKTHSGETDIYACPYCSDRFAAFNLRLNHLSEAHGIERQRYKCSICPKSFSLSHHRSAHVRKYHLQERNHVCSVCSKAFFSTSRLKEHMTVHSGEKNFLCEVCLKSFNRKFSLLEHLKIHNNVKEHVCVYCEKAFTQKCTLKSHIKTHEKGAVIGSNTKFVDTPYKDLQNQ